ncbi:MAG: ABC transporter substrate-binding protein [Halobacteriaceae archaeon]
MSGSDPEDGTRGPTRRELLQAGAGAAALGLAGCSGFGGGGDTADRITFLHFETDQSRRAAIRDMGAAWSAQSDVGFNQRDVPEADLTTEILAALQSNTLPTVGELSTRALYGARNALQPADANQVIQAIGEDQFYDSVLRFTSTGDGGHYGVPLYTWQQLTLYRPSIRQEFNLPEPTDYASFREFAETTHDPDNNVYGCLLGSDRSQFTLQCFQPFALANDASVFDEDGNIVFDEQPMIDALSFYGEMARRFNPPGDMGPGDVGQVWGNKQTHLYSSNTISFYFEALGTEAGNTVDSIGVVPYVEEERRATFGEVVSTANFKVGDSARRQAGRSWQEFLRSRESVEAAGTTTSEGGSGSFVPYLRFLHLQVGLFNPVIEGMLDSDAYLDHPNIQKWPDAWTSDVIPQAIENMERFGFRGDQVFPEIGQITGQFLITDAVRRVIDGDDAETVANDIADRMRNAIEG